MIDHVSIAVRNLAASARFYDAVLAPLGLRRLTERPATIGFGKTYPEFWLNARPHGATPSPDTPSPETGLHICLRAPSADAVQTFHRQALAAGGICDGPPSDRQAALTPYFAAFIRDLDGNKIEAAFFPKPS